MKLTAQFWQYRLIHGLSCLIMFTHATALPASRIGTMQQWHFRFFQFCNLLKFELICFFTGVAFGYDVWALMANRAPATLFELSSVFSSSSSRFSVLKIFEATSIESRLFPHSISERSKMFSGCMFFTSSRLNSWRVREVFKD